MTENLTRENAGQFIRILGEAAFDYAKNRQKMSVQEWLCTYLSEKINDRNLEDIQQDVQRMTDAIRKQNAESIAMQEYLASGKTAESWFLKKMNESGLSAGQQAKNMTKFLLTLQKSKTNIEEFSETQWEDANWNRFQLKELASQVLRNVNESSVQSAINQNTVQIINTELFQQKETLDEKILNQDEIKLIVGGALKIAGRKGILPEFSPEDCALLAGNIIDNIRVWVKVGKGELTFAEGMQKVQEQSAVVTGEILGNGICAAVGTLATVLFENPQIGIAVGTFVKETFGEKINADMTVVSHKISSAVGNVLCTVKDGLKNGMQKILNFS